MTRSPSQRLLPLALLVFAGGPGARAALVPYDLEQLSVRSTHIVCGKVTKVESYWGMMGQLGPVILTDVTLRVEERWKGDPRATEITVQFLGGKIGDRWQWCAESPRFEIGEEVLLFARPWNGRLWTSGWIQGKFRIERRSVPGSRPEDPPRTEASVRGRKGLPVAKRERLADVRSRVRGYIELAQKKTRRAARRPSPSGGAGSRSAATTQEDAGTNK
ncbi:MAG: hypothetical protein O7J95_07160 [Planctomycetota bacterium]|nr:hypothetical protein [Planctomycetota bacterium]